MKKTVLLFLLPLLMSGFIIAFAPAVMDPAVQEIQSAPYQDEDEDPTPEPTSESEEEEGETETETEEEEGDGDDAEQDEGSEDGDGPVEVVFVNPEDEGPAVVSGLVTYTNPFFGAGTVQPMVILEDQTGFVDRNRTYIFPLESQTLGQITSDFKQSPFSYSLSLPIEPQGGSRDVDNDDEDEVGVQIFAVAYWDNTYGGPFLEERDLSGGGWSTGYASTLVSSELETERELIGGKLLVYAPDDTQSFPINYGEDGLLFSEDDADMVTLPQGWTTVDIDEEPFTFDRSRVQEIPLLEPEGAELIDFSDQSYTEAFDSLVEELRESYAFTDIKEVDWDALKEEFMPLFEEAEEEGDLLAYRRALQNFGWRIPDGHISAGVVIEDFREAAGGGIGLGIRDVDDGRVIANFVLDGGPAAEIGVELGAEIVSIQGVTTTLFIDDAVAYSAPFSTDHAERLQKLRYATRYPLGTEVELGFVNPESTELITGTVVAVGEFESFNQSSFNTGRTGIELPVEFDILDNGYGYVDIPSFFDNQLLTVQLWERMINDLNDNQIPGLVIDMRQNGGGFGYLADVMSAYFFEEELILGNVEIYDELTGEFIIRPENEDKFILPPDRNLYYDGEIVVLVGPACASACEFFSFNMTLNDRATIVGQYPTAGLGGSVNDLEMPEGITVRYTVGRAVGPDGTIHIEGIGVAPDVVVPVTEETLFTEEDVILQTAIEVLDGSFTVETPEITEDMLMAGDAVSGTLEAGTTDAYTVLVEEGDIVSIYAEAENQKSLDLILQLLDTEGRLILDNDDLTSKTLNPGLEDLEIPADLILIVQVLSFNEDDSGEYTLRIERVEPEAESEDEGASEGESDEDSSESEESDDSSDSSEEEDADTSDSDEEEEGEDAESGEEEDENSDDG